ncbi:MAG: SIMPL domain-containing protein [Anaerolineae bacterium]|jgi:uncharacterized protein YggE
MKNRSRTWFRLGMAVGLMTWGAMIAIGWGLGRPVAAQIQPVLSTEHDPVMPEMPAQQGPPQQTPMPVEEDLPVRIILVVGRGAVAFEPDMARVTLGVEVTDPSIMSAVEQADTATERVIATLIQQGVAEEDIQTTAYNIRTSVPGVNDEPAPDAPISYVVESQLGVTVRELEALGDLLGAAIEAGVNQVFALSLSLSDPTELQEQTRRLAVEDARQKAQAYAQLYDGELGPVLRVSEIIDPIAPIETADGLGGAGPPVAPGQDRFVLRIQVTYELR